MITKSEAVAAYARRALIGKMADECEMEIDAHLGSFVPEGQVKIPLSVFDFSAEVIFPGSDQHAALREVIDRYQKGGWSVGLDADQHSLIFM